MTILSDAQKAKRAATRQRNAATNKNQAQLKAKLVKVEAIAADTRGNEHERAVAVEAAAKLRKVAERHDLVAGVAPLPMPERLEPKATKRTSTNKNLSQIALAIKTLERKSIQNVVEIGKLLHEASEQCTHGE
jgi:hypothetical protein